MRNIFSKSFFRQNLPLFIILAIVTVLYLLVNSIGAVHDALGAFTQSLLTYLVQFGIVGSFIICLLGNASIIIQIPYYPAVILLGSQAPSYSYLIALTIVSGCGMTKRFTDC